MNLKDWLSPLTSLDDDYDDYRGGSTMYIAKDKDENLSEEETIRRLEKMDITVIENFLRKKKLNHLREQIKK